MQCLSPKSSHCVTYGNGYVCWTSCASTVHRISDYWMAQMRQMHPDLMRASGLKTDIEQGQAVEFLPKPIMRHGLPTAFTYAHALPLPRVPPYRGLDRPSCNQFTLDQSLIPPLNLAHLELPGQRRAGFKIMRHRDEPGCVAIQPVHDSCPWHFGGRREVEQEGVLDRPARMSRGRMHDLSGRLVQNNQVIVGKYDVQG